VDVRDHSTPAALSRTFLGLREIQRVQSMLDRELWQSRESRDADLRHIALHVASCSGRLAKLCERRDHAGESDDLRVPEALDVGAIAADLLIHSAQIANIVDDSLAEWVVDRWARNVATYAPESPLGATLSRARLELERDRS
jgi:hypothetical protein